MKEQIYKICTQLNDGQIAVTESQEQLLLLFSVSGSYSADDMSKAWSEGYHRKADEINGNELRYFDVWLANYH